MLNEADIEFMKQSRDEILTYRTRPVSFIYEQIEYDSLGTPIGKSTKTETFDAIVTEISSASGANPERTSEGGIVFDEGDIKVDVNIELIEHIADDIKRMEHGGKEYMITAMDKKGIGERNRYEIIGREIS